MTPAAYYDWWFFSGICPGIPTRPANYAVLGERLSAAGVHLIVLWELLLDNADLDDDANYILPLHIYGSHDRVVAAARAVGASRLAENVATRPDSSVVPESHREMKLLLKQFATGHKAELARDLARHGDPRSAPGFDKRKARRRRDEQWGENNLRFMLVDQIPFFTEPMNELKNFLSKGMVLAEISARNEAMAHLACLIKYDFPRWSESPQPPEVAQFLEETRRLIQQYPNQMPAWGSAGNVLAEKYGTPDRPAPEVSADQDTLYQLYLIGPYQAESVGPLTVITWDTVPALDNEIAPTGLRFTYGGKFPPQFLAAWPEVQRRFKAALPGMSEKLLSLGRERFSDDELGQDEQILAQVSRGMLGVTVYADEPDWHLECWWDVEWDPEHGCTFEIDSAGGCVG